MHGEIWMELHVLHKHGWSISALAREFGLFVGPSSGAHLLAARDLRAQHPDLRHVVTFFCDEGEKYINDYFLDA